MTNLYPQPGVLTDPLQALIDYGGGLAVLTACEGGFPRRPGALLAILPDSTRAGQLGAGCVDADIAAHLPGEAPVAHLTYGRGGPVDLPLPCGGRIEVALLRRPDPALIAAITAARQNRQAGEWHLDPETGQMLEQPRADAIRLHHLPPCAVHLYGATAEAQLLAAMLTALNLPVTTRDHPAPDPWTAVVSLFHDHDKEPEILARALQSPAFYIGAMGSARTARIRNDVLIHQFGLPEIDIARLHSPIGLVAPARDARMLATSVLAQVLAEYQALTE